MDNNHIIFPGAVLVEGPGFARASVPSQQIQQTEELVHRRPGKNNFFDIQVLYNITVRKLNFLLNT